MSTAASEAITLLEENFTINCATIAGAALIFFDYVITFGQEVQLFWGEQSFSAWLFFANRMVALLYASISVCCMGNIVATNVVFELIAVTSQVVTMLRLYAVTGGDRRPVMLLALMAVLNVVVNTYNRFAQAAYSVVILNRTAVCIQSLTSTAAIMTLAILWRKLYVDHRPAIADLLSTRNPSLAAQLLRDGTIQLT
ncbi:uncharacterized protein LAESUDRAFT_211915 [Laetiporus sulphureus 93-53]|uniref:DUF6533 domain-containing protein n=1 Tax=Laetiporus sulphureus 93-53 TaxID=1314785 RepID=A0A165DVJ6_9APHY|nr:uncharacterized protein LAESUDRAFT_211915 [Laetiporus sulphureus 93-53]KZT05714.1 hypothetical protein LAESUDRAFT_211915 [Laetiporus sulphureus 93-53]